MRNKKAIGIMLAVIMAVSVFTAVMPGIASESSNTIATVDISSASKAKSILQIENVKLNLTDAQKKLSTDLLQLVNSSFLLQGQNRETLELPMKRLGQFRPASSVSPASDGRVAGDLVYVYVYLKPPAGTRTIDPYVREVTDRDEKNHLAVAWVEVKDLETLASLEAVRTIRTVMPPLVRTGSVTSEARSILQIENVKSNLTDAQKKLSTDLLQLVNSSFQPGDLVYVYVYLKPPAGTHIIDPYVREVTDRDEKNHLAVAWVEVKDLETLASLGAVRTIRTVMPPLVRTP